MVTKEKARGVQTFTTLPRGIHEVAIEEAEKEGLSLSAWIRRLVIMAVAK